ncbi:MAG: FAD-dependent oxidoreductase, partial [Massilia sp.]
MTRRAAPSTREARSTSDRHSTRCCRAGAKALALFCVRRITRPSALPRTLDRVAILTSASGPVSAPFPSCEVLVIGAGPAGSACARILARSGVDVLLVDQHPPGRDKTCGDGLIPDAHKALARLGLLDDV